MNEELKSASLKTSTRQIINEWKEKWAGPKNNLMDQNLRQSHDTVLIENETLQDRSDELKHQFCELEFSSQLIEEDNHQRKSLDRSNEILKNVFELDEQKENPELSSDLKNAIKLKLDNQPAKSESACLKHVRSC